MRLTQDLFVTHEKIGLMDLFLKLTNSVYSPYHLEVRPPEKCQVEQSHLEENEPFIAGKVTVHWNTPQHTLNHTVCNSKLPLRQTCKPYQTNFRFLHPQMHQVIYNLSFSFWQSSAHTWALTRLKNDWLCPLGRKGSLSCAHWAAFHRWGSLVFSQIPKRSVPKPKKRISIILPRLLGTIVTCWAPAPVEKKIQRNKKHILDVPQDQILFEQLVRFWLGQ